MQKQQVAKEEIKKEEIIGSETVLEKIKRKTPWVFGSKLRKPKLKFPKFKIPRLSLPMPTRSLSIIAIFIILFVLQTGVAYFIVRKPPALGADSQGNPIFIYPDIHESFIIEGIVASILIFLCSTGFILLYQASKYVYNRKMAIYILVIGVLMTIITFIALQYILAIKTGNISQ
ncbi:MAG: hypothetical protein ACFFB0_14780 [Promethearchaeota archaeon]